MDSVKKVQRVKCFGCNKPYNMFLFSEDKGWDYDSYECPGCHSKRKELIGEPEYPKGIEGMQSLGSSL